MIPPMTASGVLPPFVAGFPAAGAGSMAPYETTMLEMASRLCTTTHRVKLFKGLLELRAELRRLGIVTAVQWVDGSFCEEVESTRGKPPGDIDVVTLLLRTSSLVDPLAWQAVWNANQHVFNPKLAKAKYGCEAFYIDGTFAGYYVAEQITYWFGLFTHQRASFMWKGMLQIPLVSDDVDASSYVDNLTFNI